LGKAPGRNYRIVAVRTCRTHAGCILGCPPAREPPTSRAKANQASAVLLNGKSILITGGTGSFGKAFVAETLRRYPDVKRLVIFSRDELKQYKMAQVYSEERYPAVRFFLGDVRDRDRLRRALQSIDTVVHAAALKHVPAAEYNPMEFVRTNIIGAENLIEASMDREVERIVALSTDKAAAPINLYGATKLCSDKLFVAANNYAGAQGPRFAVVRYGNVMGSRGSVIPFFLDEASSGVLKVTDPRMTRFNISIRDAVDMVLWALERAQGGEIFVPKIPSFRLVDLAEAIGPSCEMRIVGIRPGEKIHEEMITSSDSFTTVDLGKYYAILPTRGRASFDNYPQSLVVGLVEPGFSYNSGANPQILSVEEIRAEIREHMDPGFQPV
jgi:UDP-N-acetylglucosamine 4,6-dehydratase/5-epimerase